MASHRLRKIWNGAHSFLLSLGLSVVVFADETCGGPLDSRFLFGFGRHLGGHGLPTPKPTVPRCLRDYIDGGVEGRFKRVPASELDAREDSVRHALRGPRGTYRIEGLLPSFDPAVFLLCPTYYSTTELVLRRLSPKEILRIYQLPMSMDRCFEGGLNITQRLPFEDSPSPVLFASIFRQIWGDLDVGGSTSVGSAGVLPPKSEESTSLSSLSDPTTVDLASISSLSDETTPGVGKAGKAESTQSQTSGIFDCSTTQPPSSPTSSAPSSPPGPTSAALSSYTARETPSTRASVETLGEEQERGGAAENTYGSLDAGESGAPIGVGEAARDVADRSARGQGSALDKGEDVAPNVGESRARGVGESAPPGISLWLPDVLANALEANEVEDVNLGARDAALASANGVGGEVPSTLEKRRGVPPVPHPPKTPRLDLKSRNLTSEPRGPWGRSPTRSRPGHFMSPTRPPTIPRAGSTRTPPWAAAGPSNDSVSQESRDGSASVLLGGRESNSGKASEIEESVPRLLAPEEQSESSSEATSIAGTLDLSRSTFLDEADAFGEEPSEPSLGAGAAETAAAAIAPNLWRFTFDEGVPRPGDDDSRLTDDSTLTSLRSVPTRTAGGPSSMERTSREGEATNQAFGLEPSELGPPLKTNAGPPFTVGDVVHCELKERRLIQMGVVLEADHPRYSVLVEDGTRVDTSNQKTFLLPLPAPGQFAPPQLAPVLRRALDELGERAGSMGVHLDAQRISLQRIREEKAFAKAVKADDAEVPKYLWNRRITFERDDAVRDLQFERMRKFGHRLFVRALLSDCIAHVVQEHGSDWKANPRRAGGKLTALGRDLHAITNLLYHATHTNWFEYQAGSRLVHFRFPLRYRKMARDGVPIFFEKAGPSTQDPQPSFSDPKVRDAVRTKIEKVLHRRYLLRTDYRMKSLIKYFAVPKGEDDVRLVYDATANRLNDCVWAPSFWLPTIETLLRALDQDSWMADRDIGEMFLNFQLHQSAIPFTGVDLGPLYEDQDVDERWACWDRNLMGFGPSPYNSIKMSLVAEEICKGDKTDPSNPFQWESVRLNLPGSAGYDPSISWVSKRRRDGRIACDIFTFVDDERVTGPDEELAWLAAHVMAAKQSYLGMQDAGRKVRPCSQTPGAWAGAVVHVIRDLGVCSLTSEDKWNKLKSILSKWSERLDVAANEGAALLNHKELLSDRGFLVYVTRNYPAMVPYLKGFHLTVEMWRGNRDAEGWKLKMRDDSSLATDQSLESLDVTHAGAHGMNLAKQATFAPGVDEDEDAAALLHRAQRKAGDVRRAPETGVTPAVPRLRDDVDALMRLSDFELPPLRVVRSSNVVQVFYGFGDAAGKGFGATVAGGYEFAGTLSPPRELPGGVHYRVGVWSADERKESSNYKELCNLVETAEEEADAGRLLDSEFFLFTDNSTAESCFYRGSSSSKKLHELVVRLRLLEIKHNVIVHLVHVSGDRMIAQGTDGCSRGILMEGVMAGEDMLSFVELARDAIRRHPPLLDWIRSWTKRPDLVPLSPEGWFEEGHGIVGGALDKRGVWIPEHEPKGRMHLWAPPPAAADAALEELLKARHKRTDTYHVVVIPRLMAPRWRRLFNKACDFTFVVPAGRGVSSERHCWWKWEGPCASCSKPVKPLQGIFCGNFCESRDGFRACRAVWHEECYTCQGKGIFPMSLTTDLAQNVWHKEEERQRRLNEGVSGAHLCIPFQCETCWMRNLEGRDVREGDEAYVMCLRRANLDAISGKSHLTIGGHRRETASIIRNCARLGKTPSLKARGQFPLEDQVGMGVAVDMLQKSLTARGRIKEYIQFDSMRTVRSTYTKSYESAPVGVEEGFCFTRGTGRVRPSGCPTQSEWFQSFLAGAESRMGFETEADHAVSADAIVALLECVRLDADAVASVNEANTLWKFGAYVALTTACSLRGYEGFYADLAGIAQHLSIGREGEIPEKLSHTKILSEDELKLLPHITITLLGKFKGEGGIGQHMICVANESTSGLQTRWWVEKAAGVATSEGRTHGPFFADCAGNLHKSADYNALFHKYLARVQEETDYIDKEVDVPSRFNINRTPRKTATTRAQRSGLGKKYVDAMNRWRTIENAKGKRPRFHMRQLYAEAALLMPTTWLYSYAF